MNIFSKFAVLASLVTTSVALAQTASTACASIPVAPASGGLNVSSAKVSFSVESSYHKFDNDATDSVFTVTPKVTIEDLFVKGLDLGVAMPTFDQGNLGVGGFDLFADYKVWSGNTLGGKAAVTLGGGALVPAFDTAFSPDNIVPHVNAGLSLDWGKVELTEKVSFDYAYDGVFFNPILGGMVEEGVLASKTGLAWQTCDWFSFGANLDAQYALDTESTTVLAGPSFELTPSKNFGVEFGVGLPVYQDVDSTFSETDWVAHGGFSFSF
jgi:hypothetical protein